MKGLFPRKILWDLIWVIVFFLFVLGIQNFLVLLWANTINGETIGQGGRTYSIKGV